VLAVVEELVLESWSANLGGRKERNILTVGLVVVVVVTFKVVDRAILEVVFDIVVVGVVVVVVTFKVVDRAILEVVFDIVVVEGSQYVTPSDSEAASRWRRANRVEFTNLGGGT
jgi:hypothetical protein